jgi:dTDP-4-dehydrorhamnose reductase
MKVVVTGGSGMLGHHLVRLACREHEVWGGYHAHRVDIPGCRMFALDLADGLGSKEQLKSIRPDVVIHTAALTDVDECEREREKARRINVDGTGLLAEATEQVGGLFVYISTDYVFDGERGDYREEDSPSPVNRYGETKLLGENLARQRCSKALILRTSIYGLKLPPQIGMMETLLEALRGDQTLTRFADQFFTPLYTGQLSELILRLVHSGALGLLHVGGGEKISRLAFAQELAGVFALRATLQPVSFKQIPGLARRPRDSSLAGRFVEERFGIRLPQVRRGLERLKQDRKRLVEEGPIDDRRCSS